MQVAEVNNIILLFPQTTAVPIYNRLGCWDWFGYVNKWFREYDFFKNLRILFLFTIVNARYLELKKNIIAATKKGAQILPIHRMLTRVVNE